MKNTRKKIRNKAKTRTKKMKGGGTTITNSFEKMFPSLDTKIKQKDDETTKLQSDIDKIKVSMQTKKKEINAIKEEINAIKGKIVDIKGVIKEATDAESIEIKKEELNDLTNKKNELVGKKNNLENDKDYIKQLKELNKKENELIAKNREKAVLDNNSESKDNDVLINETKKNLVLYLQENNTKSTENYAAKDFVDLVNLATEKDTKQEKDLKEIIDDTRKKAGDAITSDNEYKKIQEYFEAQKITKIVTKIKKILADFLALKYKEKNPEIKQNDLVNKYKELLNKKYDELKNQAKNYGELKTIVFDQLELKPEDHILPKEIDTITQEEYDSAINAKDNRTGYQTAKDVGTTVKEGFFSGINSIISNGSAISSSLASLAKTLIYDPNAVPKPKPLPKTEVVMGTETTDYKHPLDGTNVGQINVYKKNNSTNVDSIKSVDNFISRMQEELLNSSEKDPLQVKTPEQLFKNKDTEKRLAVFHPLSDKSKGAINTGGKKSKRKTRKHKIAKLQKNK